MFRTASVNVSFEQSARPLNTRNSLHPERRPQFIRSFFEDHFSVHDDRLHQARLKLISRTAFLSECHMSMRATRKNSFPPVSWSLRQRFRCSPRNQPGNHGTAGAGSADGIGARGRPLFAASGQQYRTKQH